MGNLAPLAERDVGITTAVVQNTTSIDLSTTTALHRQSGDIFDDLQGKKKSRGNSFTTRLNSKGEKRHGAPGTIIQQESWDYLWHRYQLDPSDVASESSYSVSSSILDMDQDSTKAGACYEGGTIGDETFDALESYVGTDDEDECSLLESVSTTSDHDCKTQYQFAAQAPVQQVVVAGPVPTPSERRATAKTRRRSQVLSPNALTYDFHRPLPLRSYESEAIMFPTAGAQAQSGHNRSKSVASLVNYTRSSISIMRHPPLPASHKVYPSMKSIRKEGIERDSSHIKISEQVDQDPSSVSKHHSNASTLAAFPIPPMENPVGELPILVSRAVASPPALDPSSSRHPVRTSSLENTYRAITKVNMTGVLQRTRARGEQLGVIDWEKLNTFERAWRDMNEVLLVTIYGRKDVVLSRSDVAYVDCVAQELYTEANEVDPMAWVRRIFEQSF